MSTDAITTMAPETPTNVYTRLGVPTIINAKGPSTRLSGGIMRPEVAEAMAQASQHCVDMADLQARASVIIAETTGAEAGYVTSGAAAGLLLGTAACVTGLDPGRMNRLPDTTGMKSEVVMVRSQRNFYDHAVRAAGVRLVEVGLPDRYAGAGVRDAEAWEIADAIGERTAAVHWVAGAGARPALEEVVEVAHAAACRSWSMPPPSCRRPTTSAASSPPAPIWSRSRGGKAIGGPQASGILCGRRDLIMAAALAEPRSRHLLRSMGAASAADRQDAPQGPAAARHRPGVQGRQGGDRGSADRAPAVRSTRIREARRARWLRLMQELADGLDGVAGTEVRLHDQGEVPQVALELQPAATGRRARADERLETGTPAIFADPFAVGRAAGSGSGR